VYSRFQHTQAIKEIYPDGYFFDIRTNQFSLWETPVAASTMVTISNNKLLIIGGPFGEAERIEIERSGIKLTEVYKGNTQIIFKVE